MITATLNQQVLKLMIYPSSIELWHRLQSRWGIILICQFWCTCDSWWFYETFDPRSSNRGKTERLVGWQVHDRNKKLCFSLDIFGVFSSLQTQSNILKLWIDMKCKIQRKALFWKIKPRINKSWKPFTSLDSLTPQVLKDDAEKNGIYCSGRFKGGINQSH